MSSPRRIPATAGTARVRALLPVLTIALLAQARGVSAQTGLFFDEFGAGFKATAMGQAFTAVADDYSAAYYNPAGLTQLEPIFENASGYIYAKPQVSARFPEYPSLSLHGQPPSRGLFSGIASSLDLEETVAVFPWFRRFAFGLVSWLNLPEINQYRAGPIASRPHFLRHDMRFQLLALVVSLGFEVTPWLSIGGGVIPSLDSVADQDNFAATNMREDEVMGLRLSIHQTAKLFVVPVLGVLVKPPWDGLRDRLSLGVSFRGENKGNHGKGPLNQVIGVEDENGNPVSGIYYPPAWTINLVSFAPRQVTLGVAALPLEDLTVAFDLTWKEYSRYRTYLEQAPDPPFDDTFTPRVGLDYRLPGMELPWPAGSTARVRARIGYYFEPTPVPNRQGQDNIFDSDQDVYSAGLSLVLREQSGVEHDIEALYQYHRFREIGRDSLIDPVYAFQNEIDATGITPVEIGGDVWSVGLNYTMRF